MQTIASPVNAPTPARLAIRLGSASSEATLPSMLISQAQQQPDHIAIEAGNDKMTYAEFAAASLAIGGHLRQAGCGVDDCVGLFVEPSVEQMLGAWGILFAGSAYLPLSPDYPEDRLRYMLSDGQVQTVFTQEKLRERISALAPHSVQIITINDITGFRNGDALEQVAAASDVASDALAYVVYTSGSTGRPKGVMIEHRSIASQMRWLSECCGVDRTAKVIQKTPISFDAAQWEILALACGATVVMGTPGIHRNVDEIIDLIVASGVTTLQCVPTLLQALVDGGRLSACRHSLTTILSGAESLPTKLAMRCLEELPGCELVNVYGPAECTINASFCLVRSHPGTGSGNSVSIGLPVRDTQFHILDEHRNPVAVGDIGELYIGGIQVARGYLHHPELTSASFLMVSVHGSDHPVRLYRTGDLAIWNADGSASFAGRRDGQVKIRGMRVELEEVKVALEAHDWIRRAAVIAKPDPHTNSIQILACVELVDRERHQAKGFDPNAVPDTIRDDLLEVLPDFMIPNQLLVVDRIPLTTSGKIDFDSLAKWEELSLERPIIKPATDTELRISNIWKGVLKRNVVSIRDNFFAFGGDSLSAVNLIVSIDAEFGTSLPLDTIFKASSIEKLAKAVEAGRTGKRTRLIRLQPRGNASPVFCWPGLGGYPMNLKPVADRLSPHRPFYGVQALGINKGERPHRNRQTIAMGDIEEILRMQKEGPYALWGYSYGAEIAYEAAYQLEQAGHKVENLILIAPGRFKDRPSNASDFDIRSAYMHKEFVALLFTVFARSTGHPALDQCQERTHDENSFCDFIVDTFDGMDRELVGRIAQIVMHTYGKEYSAEELHRRVISAPTMIARANDDSPSYLEDPARYFRGVTIVHPDIGHFDALTSSGLERLAVAFNGFPSAYQRRAE